MEGYAFCIPKILCKVVNSKPDNGCLVCNDIFSPKHCLSKIICLIKRIVVIDESGNWIWKPLVTGK